MCEQEKTWNDDGRGTKKIKKGITKRAPRVLFFGMQGNFSAPSLTALLEREIEVCAVVIPASPLPGRNPAAIQRRDLPRTMRSPIPLLNTAFAPSIVQTAWERRIPVWEVHRLANAETVAILADYQPDMICVACFSLFIPRVVIDLARFGTLNVHPSLLPANRGPLPLFWTFREGHTTTGVTIHLIDEGMDSGDILVQETIEVLDGMSYDLLESQCALHGGALLARTVWDRYEGRARRTPQDETKSSYHSFPTDEDFVVHAEAWSARHVYNFIRGIRSWDSPVVLYSGNERFLVQDAHAYSQNDIHVGSDKGYHGGDLVVPCRVGWVGVKL